MSQPSVLIAASDRLLRDLELRPGLGPPGVDFLERLQQTFMVLMGQQCRGIKDIVFRQIIF